MNICRFINSRDIRRHLEEIHYSFNALEASWLVYQSADATFEEKHQAWKWIISNMPDMEVIKRPNCVYRKSLHDTLKKYMAMEEDYLELFKIPEDPVYTCEFVIGGDNDDREKVFFSLDKCVSGMNEYWRDYDADELKYRSYAAVTRYFKDKDYQIEVCYSCDGKITSVALKGESLKEEYDDLTYYFFDGLWFDFPTPFKKGDIVCMHYYDPDDRTEHGICYGIMVLESLLPWYLKEEGERSLNRYLEGDSGDNSDMTVYGYFMFEDGDVYHECTHNYMDLEYYRGPLKDIRRLYIALSNFIKGEIDIDLLLYAYRNIVMEKLQQDSSMNWFTDEGLRLAGLKEVLEDSSSSILSILDDADRKLQEKSIAGINEKYTGDIKERALVQIGKELEIVRKQGSAPGYLAALDVLNAVDAKPEEFCMKGTGGSSLLAYSLGLSDIEPLTALPNLYPELYFGIYGEKMPHFELDVTMDLRERVFAYYEKQQDREHITLMGDTQKKHSAVNIRGIKGYSLIADQEIDMVQLGFDTQVFDEMAEDSSEKDKSVKEFCDPKTYAEYVKYHGFLHGVGVWEDNAEVLLKNKEVSFDEVIGTREDVYEYLIRHGVDIQMSFEISEAVRKGKIHSFGWTEKMLDAMDEANIPIWYRISCEKVQYLMPRCRAMMFFKRFDKITDNPA